MTLAKSLEKVASKVIAKFGGDVTIRYVTAGSYNTTTGGITETASDINIKGVFEDVNLREANELIQAGDKRLTVAANDLATAPETKDRVVISSVVHQIVRVETTEQDNTAITYELVLRA
tara:strand:+ start:1636 stop:1992 length:357 start_codon:yes stop_codon:yes gene_type:complete